MIHVFHEPDELRSYVEMLRRNRISVGCVPTMGALHEGHAALIRRSYRENDRTVVTVFVNPLQFEGNGAFEAYPRDLEADVAVCRDAQASVVFAPTVQALQPPGRTTLVHVDGVSHDYEGAVRKRYFEGAATICATLFNLVQPDRAYFGQKDYQQTVVVRRMVQDLHFPLDVVVCPTVRDDDGLALSSCNEVLSDAERDEALRLPRALAEVERAVLAGESDADVLRTLLREGLESPLETVNVDYADIVHPDTLVPLATVSSRAVALAGLRVSGTRLLDNVLLAPPGTPAWEA